MVTNDVISQVQSLERRPDKVIVEVAVMGPIKLESTMRQRARARALLASGVLKTTYETVTDIPMGEINRLTEVTATRRGGDVEFDRVPVLDKLLQKKVFTVEVNR